MSYVMGIVLASLAMAILVATTHQVWTYLRGQTLISRRQFALRLTTGALLLLTIGMIFYATVRPPTDPVTALLLWGALTFLPLVVVVLAWMDLKELTRTRHRRQAELYRELADLQQLPRRPSPEPPALPRDGSGTEGKS